MKVLSVIIPAFNTELYIERCLDSLLYDKDIVDYLDIIVVDDGSSDSTSSVAGEYSKLYPGSISVIRKENGGHGSAVNKGLEKAVGKYVRILDSDDWVNIDDFPEYVKKLADEESDIVVTNVRRQQLYDETEDDFVFCETRVEPQNIEKVAEKIMEDNFFFEFSMHSMTVKREKLLRVWGDGLLNKTFYVDQQFVAKVFMCADNYTEYPLLVYMYFIGRPEQSMGAGFFKHIRDHERVLRWLLSTTEMDEVPEYYKKIVSRQITLMLKTHHKAYLEQPKLNSKERKELATFDEYLKSKYRSFYDAAEISGYLKLLANPLISARMARTFLYFRKGEK
ncbi:glycosyltransferase family 2 protein [Candidatus Saccharibacteria bacterium]|nr:glycosyltransferase family 2 protein [Candidatus Saccharibacteria bacterium]